MSRSLSRIRNLVSEIEEIHRQGQQGGQAALKAASPSQSVERIDVPQAAANMNPPFPVEVQPIASLTVPSVSAPTRTPISSVPAVEEGDAFAELASMVNLHEQRSAQNELFQNEPVQEGKISLQLSGSVSLFLQIKNTGETLEVKQKGDILEIRFADGKAFHLPLKTVA